MAITHVQAFGSNGSKSAGTTLAVTATPSPQPAVGDLIIATCSRDDIANDPLTGDSISDGHGNTYTRQTFAGQNGTDATGANGINLIVFWCQLTVAWSGATTVTWTHPSVTARGMQVEHFAPDSGYTINLYGTPATGALLGNPAALTAASPSPEGDLLFGAVAVANDTSVSVTGDSDTLGGSWSTITTAAGTTGGTGNTNAFVCTQYKILTAPSAQVWNVTLGASSSTGNALLSFHQYPSTGPYLVGIGAQVASSTGNVTPPLPPGTTANDLLVMVIAGRPSSSSADGVTIASGADGWAQHGSTSYVAVASVDDLSVQVWWKLHDGSESDPTVSVNSVLAAAAATDRGYSAQIAAFRNIHASVPFDVSAVTSNNAAAATWTPTGVTTAHANSVALSVVATADDNALNFNTSQSFTTAFGGTEYDTVTGADHAVGLAYKVVSAAGAVTEPTWNQSANGNDQWVGLSTALRAAGSGTAYDLGGTTSLTTTLAGSLTVAHPLAGTTALTTTLSGSFKKVHRLSGGTKIPHQGPHGGLHKTVGLAGTTSVTFTLAGSFIASHPLAGTTGLTTTLSGAFKRTVYFAGATSLTTAVSSTGMQRTLRLDGTTGLTTSLAGAISRGVDLGGTTGLTTSLSGRLKLVAQLNGQTSLVTAFTGDLLTIRLLSGATSLTVAADGSLVVDHPLAGTVTLTTTLAGELTEILGPNAFLKGKVLASVVDTTIRANVVRSPITAGVVTDRIEASVQ